MNTSPTRDASTLRAQLLAALLLAVVILAAKADAQTPADSAARKPQAKAPPTQPFGAEAFGPSKETTLRWLGMAGFLINSRGTTVMIDPLLQGFDMPVMITFPIASSAVPRLTPCW